MKVRTMLSWALAGALAGSMIPTDLLAGAHGRSGGGKISSSRGGRHTSSRAGTSRSRRVSSIRAGRSSPGRAVSGPRLQRSHAAPSRTVRTPYHDGRVGYHHYTAPSYVKAYQPRLFYRPHQDNRSSYYYGNHAGFRYPPGYPYQLGGRYGSLSPGYPYQLAGCYRSLSIGVVPIYPDAGTYYGDPIYVDAGPQAPAALELHIVPEDAEVLLDGQLMGPAHLYAGGDHVLPLEPGTHLVELRAPGFQALRLRLTVDAGGRYRIDQTLAPGPGVDPRTGPSAVAVPAAPGSEPAGGGPAGGTLAEGLLHLRVQPSDAVIYLDGAFLSRADELAQLPAPMPLEPGPHVLQVVRPGYRDVSRQIVVEAATRQMVLIELVPAR